MKDVFIYFIAPVVTNVVAGLVLMLVSKWFFDRDEN